MANTNRKIPFTTYRQVFLIAACSLWCSFATDAVAGFKQDVAGVIDAQTAPPGVVFEIVSGDKDYLLQAIPAVRDAADALRKRFPDLSIAVVTHGSEQFALMSSKQTANEETHKLVKLLGVEQDIQVHVCGTHAGWYDVDKDDFPAYVDVAPAAPAQINNYVELGYVLINVRI